jgi:hypothetical protein
LIDEEGHVYVYMTIESIEQALGRCHQKSCKVLKEQEKTPLAEVVRGVAVFMGLLS